MTPAAHAPVVIRTPSADDADAIARVHVESWRETYGALLPERFFGDEALTARQRMWRSILSRDPAPERVAVAERGRSIVGFAQAGAAAGPDAEKGFPPARPLHLYTIYV
ncbi:hypothetical protein [Microbacterium sp. 10M-3C3]|uniref:hypothetical protein n=1 Tax=Microbacterium sp. 10M-3C3 TaxID=2483401 RepID=UPI00197C191F|nr:hypothetical protein [Microbacterium sp. 10M-3C3]